MNLVLSEASLGEDPAASLSNLRSSVRLRWPDVDDDTEAPAHRCWPGVLLECRRNRQVVAEVERTTGSTTTVPVPRSLHTCFDVPVFIRTQDRLLTNVLVVVKIPELDSMGCSEVPETRARPQGHPEGVFD